MKNIINNAIVLIDQIDIERSTMELRAAIIAASQKRLRPILLTSATTILGLTPMALTGGALWKPMAVLMMSGLALASILTLFFVPAGYFLLFRLGTTQRQTSEERRREIATMRALGARRITVLVIVLLEACLITLIGGIVGLLGGHGGTLRELLVGNGRMRQMAHPGVQASQVRQRFRGTRVRVCRRGIQLERAARIVRVPLRDLGSAAKNSCSALIP